MNVLDRDIIGRQSRQCAPIGVPGFSRCHVWPPSFHLSDGATQTRFLPSSVAECTALFAASMTSETAFGRGQAGFLGCLMASVDASPHDAATVLVSIQVSRQLTVNRLDPAVILRRQVCLFSASCHCSSPAGSGERVVGKRRLARDGVASATTSARPSRRIDPVRPRATVKKFARVRSVAVD